MISTDIMPRCAKRTALLIRCSVEEASAIRSAARKSGRTLSGYVLNCLRTRLRVEAETEANLATIVARLKHGL
jgi:hypothetical protein